MSYLAPRSPFSIMESASPAEKPNQRQRVELAVRSPQPLAGTAGEDTCTRVTEGEPLTATHGLTCLSAE